MLAENTLLKTAYHFLLLLVGFDTLTYRKDYDRSPILVGHQDSFLAPLPTLQKKRHIRDILGRTNFFCHAYDTSMMIIVTKPGIIIDVVGSYFYDKKS